MSTGLGPQWRGRWAVGAVSWLLASGSVCAASGVDGAAASRLFAASPKEAAQTAPAPPPAHINAKGYTSATVCGSCHVDIYASWKNSLHAFSLSDPIFDAAYMQALKEKGDAARRLCLRCHAPLTQGNGDFDLRQAVTREGVSCDFCHTLTAVHLDNAEKPYSMEVGLVKRSVLRKAASPVHEVAYSQLHATAELCGGCHNYTGPGGVPIMSTYDEWKRGPYAAEGITCQSCHMATSTGRVVSPSVAERTAGEIHLHDLVHDAEQLRHAVTVAITRTVRRGDGLEVDVHIANVGSGHAIPTGIPSREVVLSVTAEVGRRVMTAERRYRKVLADKNDHVLGSDHETLLYAAKVVSDTRLGPREERLEHFSFLLPGSGPVKIQATVSYVYVAIVLDQRRLHVTLSESAAVVQ